MMNGAPAQPAPPPPSASIRSYNRQQVGYRRISFRR
jgi:hypothetical protein